MKKRILHVISSLKRGGAESLLCAFLNEVKKDEHYEHVVIYFHGGPNVEVLQEIGVVIYQVKGIISLYDPIFFWRFIFLVKRLAPSCIHAWLWSANFVSRIAGKVFQIPTINALHNNVDQDGKIRNLLDRYTYWMPEKILSVSEGICDSVKSIHGFAPVQMTVVKNGIRKSDMPKKISKKSLSIPEEGFVIGSVGRFVYLKNYRCLLKAAALLLKKNPKAFLVLVGSGSEERSLKDLARSLGIASNVRFIVDQPAPGYYPLFDIFVQSSFKEGISMALLEAISYGIPCVVTSANMKHEVIDHEVEGLLVPSDDQRALAQALFKLFYDIDLRSRFAGNAQEKAAQFDLGIMCKKYVALYDNLIQRGGMLTG